MCQEGYNAKRPSLPISARQLRFQSVMHPKPKARETSQLTSKDTASEKNKERGRHIANSGDVESKTQLNACVCVCARMPDGADIDTCRELGAGHDS